MKTRIVDSELSILFDAHWWVSGPPSGKSVVKGLVTAWAKEFPGDTLTLRVPNNHVRRVALDLEASGIGAKVDGSGVPVRNHALRVLTTPAKLGKYDVHLTQNFTALSGGALRFTFVHDVIFVEHPEWFSRRERIYLSAIRPSLKRADVILTSSESEANRISALWPETRNRVVPIGLANPLWTELSVSKEVGEMASSARPFLLAVGRLNERKNLARLIEAYSLDPAISADFDLLVVGDPDGLAPDLSGRGNKPVTFLRDIDDSKLRWLYERASALIFPSLEEGFGLPLLEADYFGLPIAASDIAVFREINVADVYFDPYSPRAIAEALVAVSRLPRRTSPRSVLGWANVVRTARLNVLASIEGAKR